MSAQEQRRTLERRAMRDFILSNPSIRRPATRQTKTDLFRFHDATPVPPAAEKSRAVAIPGDLRVRSDKNKHVGNFT
jgi:hypothetical protein